MFSNDVKPKKLYKLISLCCGKKYLQFNEIYSSKRQKTLTYVRMASITFFFSSLGSHINVSMCFIKQMTSVSGKEKLIYLM